MGDDSTEIVRIEIPKGSRNKYEYDEDLDAIKLDRFLFSSMVYPTDYGYFPETCGEDGDALDAMVCVSEPTFPGCVIEAKPIALFKMEDDQGIDDKILCVPIQDPSWNTLSTLDDMPNQLRDEIEHFFSVYKDLEQKKVKVDGWYGRGDALTEIQAARERCAEHHSPGDGHGGDSLEDATPVEKLSDKPGGPDGDGEGEPASRGSGHEPADRL